MEADIQSLRREAALAGRAVMANTLSYDEFMSRFGESDDDLVSGRARLSLKCVAECVASVAHLPGRSRHREGSKRSEVPDSVTTYGNTAD